MQAVILCGGKGTRLASLYSDRPKILVPVAGRPFIEWQLEWLGRQGISDIHLAGGYKADVLKDWVARRSRPSDTSIQNPETACPFTLHLSRFTFRVSVSAEPSPLGTGGGLRYVVPSLSGARFIAINGDSLTPELDFASLMGAHARSGAAITLAVAQIREAGRYGTVEFDSTGRVFAFREKAERLDGWINAGVYVIERETLASIPDGRSTSLETELFPALAEKGKLHATPCPPPMLDMGTPAGIKALEEYLSTVNRTATHA